LWEKSSIVALATLAAVSGTAFAQSTVTLSGVYSVSYQKDLTNTAANGNPLTNNSALTGDAVAAAANAVGKGFAVTDANFKLAAVEDLGGGLKASFDTTFETGAQRGTLLTRADSGVALSGAFGSVAVRNTRSSDLIASIGSAAISLPDGLYDSSNIVARAAIDVVTYTLPAFSGVTASVSFVEGNDGAISLPTTDKSAYVLGLSYANGPLAVGAALKSTNTPAATTKSSNYELMASYDLGVAKIAYAFDGKSATTGTYADDANGVSVTVPVGAVSLGANYFKRGTNKVTEVGATYAFSKRTSLSVASGKQTADANGNQMRVRLAHAF
jgi:predicted porin